MYRLGTAILVLVPDKSRHWLVHAADNIGWDTVLYSVWLLCRSRLPAAQHTMRVRRARIPIPCLGLVSLIPEFASRLALPVPESRRPIPAPNPRRPSMPRYLSRHQSSAPLASTSPFRLVRCCLYSWNAPTPSPSPPPPVAKDQRRPSEQGCWFLLVPLYHTYPLPARALLVWAPAAALAILCCCIPVLLLTTNGARPLPLSFYYQPESALPGDQSDELSPGRPRPQSNPTGLVCQPDRQKLPDNSILTPRVVDN